MTRRADPETLYLVRRYEARTRLMAAGVDLVDAEHWLELWEAKASRRSTVDRESYWSNGEAWIWRRLTVDGEPDTIGHSLVREAPRSTYPSSAS